MDECYPYFSSEADIWSLMCLKRIFSRLQNQEITKTLVRYHRFHYNESYKAIKLVECFQLKKFVFAWDP